MVLATAVLDIETISSGNSRTFFKYRNIANQCQLKRNSGSKILVLRLPYFLKPIWQTHPNRNLVRSSRSQ